MPVYRPSASLSPEVIATSPLPAVRVLAMCQLAHAGRSDKQLHRDCRIGYRGFRKALQQAIDAGLIEEVPLTAMRLEPADPPDHDPPDHDPPDHDPPDHDPPDHDPRDPIAHWTDPRDQESAADDPRDHPPTPLTSSSRSQLTSSNPFPGKGLTTTDSTADPPDHPPSQPDPVDQKAAREAWAHAQQALSLQLTSSEYSQFVASTTFVSAVPGELTLHVSNSVARDLLGNRLRPWLKEHLAQQLGEYVDVHLILGSASAAPVPELPIADALEAAGMWEDLAADIAERHGEGPCRQGLKELKAIQERTPGGIYNPGGWLLWKIPLLAQARRSPRKRRSRPDSLPPYD